MRLTRSQKIAFALLIIVAIFGGTVYLGISWPSWDFHHNMTSFAAFLATLVGFLATIYQLGETERSIRESMQKPALQLEVLAPSGTAGVYSSQKTHRLWLGPREGDNTFIGARCALRITNSGDKTASRIYFTFVFKRKGASDLDPPGGLQVFCDISDKDRPLELAYWDYDIRAQQQVGVTFKFDEGFVVHPDPYDRPVVAEIDLLMKDTAFESDYEIQYRIQSYEGNKLLEGEEGKTTDIRGGNQIYPIAFERTHVPSGTE